MSQSPIINKNMLAGRKLQELGVKELDAHATKTLRIMAVMVMVIPFLGFLEAIRLVLTGHGLGHDLYLFLVMYVVHIGGISIGFHRLAAHRTFRTGPFLKHLFMISGSIAGQGPVMFWVATHRRHHTYSDSEGDPHSPHVKFGKNSLRGLWYAHMPWMLSKEVSSWSAFGLDILKDKIFYFYNRTYFLWLLMGLVIPTLVGFLLDESVLGAWKGFIFGGLCRLFLANQAAWCVGSISHRFGGRPFNNRDQSANNWLVALFTFGEGLQNNHHAFPGWYRHGVRWWEPDLSGWILTGLGKIGLVSGFRNPSQSDIKKLLR
jgi:stearoyl-CoA desaturase (delta-9 desaturase)